MVFIELGCEDDSELSAAVREKCFAVRITQQYDLTQRGTKGAIHGIIQLCHLYGIELHVWVSIPCTAGCPWKHINDKLGRPTGDEKLTESLIRVAVPICDHAAKIGGPFSWDWPKGNLLWKDERVLALVARRKAEM